jgi:hypothetical protein
VRAPNVKVDFMAGHAEGFHPAHTVRWVKTQHSVPPLNLFLHDAQKSQDLGNGRTLETPAASDGSSATGH